MKKALALILVLAMVVFAFGCTAAPAAQDAEEQGQPTDQTTDSPAQTTGEEAPAEGDADTAAGEVYNVCLMLPMSGPYANIGATMYAAITTAYDYFLEVVGGFEGKDIDVQFTLCDFEGDPDLAASLFEKNAGTMDASMGCYKTTATIACSSLATKYEIPFLNILSTADSACALDSNYVYKMCVTDTQSMGSIADCLTFLESKDDHKYAKASIIASSDDYGNSMGGALQSIVLPQLGWEVAALETLQVNTTTDASSAINKAKQSGSDLTCTVLSSAEAVLVQKQFKEYKFDQPVWSGGSGYFDVSFFQNVAGAGDYVVSACSWEKCMMVYGDPAAYEWYDKVTEAAGGIPFSETGACAWLACGVLMQAVQDAPTTAGPDVANTLNEMQLPKEHWANMFNQYNGISFGDMEGVVGTPMLYNVNEGATCFFVQAQNSEWKLVYMPGQELENNPIVWPHVPYSEENTYQG